MCNDIPESTAWLYSSENAVDFYKKCGWIDFGVVGEENLIVDEKDHLFGLNLNKHKNRNLEIEAKFILAKVREELDCETLNDVRDFTSTFGSNLPIRVLVQNDEDDNKLYDAYISSVGSAINFEIDLRKPSKTIDYKIER